MAGRQKRDFSGYNKPISFRPDRETLKKFRKIFDLMVEENSALSTSMVLSRAIGMLYENMIRPELRKRVLVRELTLLAKNNAIEQKRLSLLIAGLDEEINRVNKARFEKEVNL